MILKVEQKIIFTCNLYNEGFKYYDGIITSVGINTVHVAFIFGGLRPMHIDISSNDIIAIYHKNGVYQKIGDYEGYFLKVC